MPLFICEQRDKGFQEMRILVISQYYYPEPFRINEICEELHRRGHTVTVVTSNPNYPDGEIYDGFKNSTQTDNVNGVEVIRCRIRPRHKGKLNLAVNYLSFVQAANRVLHGMKIAGEYDFIYMYQLSPITSAIPAIRLKKKYGIPLFLYCLDVWPESIVAIFRRSGVIYRLIRKMSASIYKSADRVAVTSPCFIDYLANECDVDKEKIEFVPQHSNDVVYDRAISKDTEKFVFLFAGNVGESQNLEGVIRAASKVKDTSAFEIYIVGNGSAMDSVKKTISDFGMESKCRLFGRQPHEKLLSFYQKSDVCLLSLRKEGLVGYTIPGKLQEYMAASKAILGFIDGDSKAVIEEANCGICVPAEDEGALTIAMKMFIAKKVDIKRFSENARKYYVKSYTLLSHVKSLEKALKETIN